MVSAGGDSRVIGDRAAGRGRSASAIRAAARPTSSPCCRSRTSSISTSGDYERYFDAGGERFHHLIDPATGRSPASVRSVTVLAETG
jgi:thiamine biosynthesis lipoprotein